MRPAAKQRLSRHFLEYFCTMKQDKYVKAGKHYAAKIIFQYGCLGKMNIQVIEPRRTGFCGGGYCP